MSGSGSTNVANGAIFSISQAQFAGKYLDGRTLNNAGSATWFGPDNSYANYIYMQNGAVFNNTGSFDAQIDRTIFNAGGTLPVFNNGGTFTKSAGSGTTNANVAFNNSGTVNVLTGTLSLQNNGTHSGAFNVPAGATLTFVGGIHNLVGSSSINAAGVVNITNGTVNVTPVYNIAGTTNVSGGVLTFNNVAATSQLILSSGTITSTTPFTVTSVLTWTGGTMSGTGSTNVPSGARLYTDGGACCSTKYLDGRTLNNAGSATWSNAGYNPIIYLQNGAIINNSGSFDVQTDSSISNGGGTLPVFNNIGAFTKSASPNGGSTSIGIPFNNSGSVSVVTGTLQLSNGGTHTGTFNVPAGATLTFAGGTHNLVSSSTFSASGVVNVSGGAVNFSTMYNISGTTNVTNGTVTFGSAATTSQLTLSNGTITSTTPLTVTSVLTWTGGTMSGTGSTNVPSGARLYTDAGACCNSKYLDTRTLNNAGSAVWSNAGSYSNAIYMQNGATINNSGTFDVQTDSTIANAGGTLPVFNNIGAFTKSASPNGGTTSIGIQFNNSGTVNTQSGTLYLANGGTHTGTFNVPAGASLSFSGGTHNLLAGSNLNCLGTVTVNGGTVNMGGTLTNLQNLSMPGGTANLPSSGTLSNMQTLFLSGGIANFNGMNVTVVTTTLGLGCCNNPVITGTGTLTVTSVLSWTAGTMSGSGSTIIASGGRLAADNSPNQYYKYLDGRTLNVASGATATWANFNYPLYMQNGAVLNNAGTSDVQADTSINNGGGALSTVNNFGTFTKSAGSGSTAVGVVFNNSGTVNVQSGTVSLSNGGTQGGTFNVPSGRALTFSGGTHNLTSSSSINASGAVNISGGAVNISPLYNVSGTTNVSGGILIFGSAATTSQLILSNGTITSTTPVTATSVFTWTGGTMSGSGSTNVPSGARLYTDGGACCSSTKYLDGRTLNNAGSATWSNAGYNPIIYLQNGATLNNSGTFDVQTDSTIANSGGTLPVFNNTGTFTKSASPNSGSTSIDIPFNNSGSVSVVTGTLQLSSGGTHTGTFNVPAGATLTFAGGTHNLVSSSTFSASGVVKIIGGAVNFSSAYNVAGTTNISNGTVTFNNAATTSQLILSSGTITSTTPLTVTSVLTWTGGTMSGTGSTNIPSGARLYTDGGVCCSSTKFLDTRTLNNAGSAVWSNAGYNPIIYLQNGATLNNSGTFDVQTDSTIANSGGTLPVFNNTGTFTKSASPNSGSTSIDIPFNNSGSVSVVTGTLRLSSGGTHTGQFEHPTNQHNKLRWWYSQPAGWF